MRGITAISKFFYSKHAQRTRDIRARVDRSHKSQRRRAFIEPLEPRILLSADLHPGIEAGIASGLTTAANFVDTVDTLDQFTSVLPVVNQAIAPVLDLGQKVRDEFITPVQDYLDANDPTSTTQLVDGLNALPGFADTFTDESTPDEVKIRIDSLTAADTAEDIDIDFGDIADALGLDFGDTELDFTPSFSFESGFAFGFDLDPALSATEAFFLDFTGTTLEFSVETPFAGQGAPAPLDFDLNLGLLSVSVEGGSVDLDADVSRLFFRSYSDGPGTY